MGQAPADGVDLPLLAEFVERFQHVLVDLVDVGVVEHQELDVVRAKAVERAVNSCVHPFGRDLLREFAVAGLRIVVEVVPDFRRDGDFVAVLRQRFADHLFAVAVAVYVAGVEVRHVLVERVLDHVDSIVASTVAPPVRADDPGTEPDF